MDYRYPHYKRPLVQVDARFHGGPRPGSRFPDFDLTTTSGSRIGLSALEGTPFVLTLASITSPMTAAATPLLKRWYARIGDRVRFLSVYVREAHPAEQYPQPRTIEEKMAHALAWQLRDNIPWTVAVDDLEGSLHRTLDHKPSAVWFVNRYGLVAYRALSGADSRGLREGFDLLAGGASHARGESQRTLAPALRGLGQTHDVLGAAGPSALRDFRRAAPPAYPVARIAALVPGRGPLTRSMVALGLITAGTTAAVVACRNLWARSRRNGPPRP